MMLYVSSAVSQAEEVRRVEGSYGGKYTVCAEDSDGRCEVKR